MELETSGSWILGCSGESRKGQRPHRTPPGCDLAAPASSGGGGNLGPGQGSVGSWGSSVGAHTLVMGGCPEDTRRNPGTGRMATRCCSVCDGGRWEVPSGPRRTRLSTPGAAPTAGPGLCRTEGHLCATTAPSPGALLSRKDRDEKSHQYTTICARKLGSGYTHIHTGLHMHTCTYTHTGMHTRDLHTQAHTYTLAHKQAYTHLHLHTCTHTGICSSLLFNGKIIHTQKFSLLLSWD